MHLTLSLLHKMPKGNIWRGKDRINHRIFPRQVSHMEKRLQIEEKNMFYLRHPYMTLEQSSGHSQALGLGEDRMAKLKTEKAAYRVKKSVRSEDRLNHLLSTAKWEF